MLQAPTLILHADWGSSPRKRWMARATGRGDIYRAGAPEPVGEPGTLLSRLQEQAGQDGCVLLGFDFPIGLPVCFAKRAGVRDFAALLPQLGQWDWLMPSSDCSAC